MLAGTKQASSRSPRAHFRQKSCLSTRRAQEFCMSANATHTHVHTPCGMQNVSSMLCCPSMSAFISILHGMRRGSQPRFPKSPILAVLGKRSWRPLTVSLTVSVAHVYHACSILHDMSDVHAACRAVRAHVECARGRSPPRAQPGSGLLGGSDADSVGLRACTLSRMP